MDFMPAGNPPDTSQHRAQIRRRQIAPVARELDKQENFPEDLTRKMASLACRHHRPEQYGGHGMDYLAYSIACEEISPVDGSQAATD